MNKTPIIEILPMAYESQYAEYMLACGGYQLERWKGYPEDVMKILGVIDLHTGVIPLSLPTFALMFDYAYRFTENLSQSDFSKEWFDEHLRERMIRGCIAVESRMHSNTPQALLDFAQALEAEGAVVEQINIMTMRKKMEDVDDEVPF